MTATDTPGDSTAETPETPRALRHTVIYDGDCGFCKTLLAPLLADDARRRLRPVALGTPEADALLADLTPEQRNASWHLITPTGERISAGPAAAPLLRLLPHGGPLAALLERIPRTTARGYWWVAGHRDRIGPLIPDAIRSRTSAAVARRTAELG